MVGVDKPGMERYACFTGLWDCSSTLVVCVQGLNGSEMPKWRDAAESYPGSSPKAETSEPKRKVDMSLHVDRRGVGGSDGKDCRAFFP